MGKLTKNKGGKSHGLALSSRRRTSKAAANGVVVDECRYFGTEEPAALSLNHPLLYLKYSGCLPGKGTEQNNYPKVFFVWLNVERNTNL